jgi:hypothetical protein
VTGLEECGTLHRLVKAISDRWAEERAEDPGSPGVEWIVRVRLGGPCPLWAELRQEEERNSLSSGLEAALGALRVEIRAEDTHPPHRAGEHLERQDVLGESLRLLGELAGVDTGIAQRLGLEEEDLAGFDRKRHASLDDYLRELLSERDGELVSRLVQPSAPRGGGKRP